MRVDAKRCTGCGEVRAVSEFSKNRAKRDGLQPHCKRCAASRWAAQKGNPRIAAMQRESTRARAEACREWLWAEKSKPCERCGGTFHPVAMQFDHLPGRGKKEFGVSMMYYSKGLAALKEERKKCQLLCANCHHIVTWERKTGETVELDAD
jgi:hypothetical protein